MPGRPRKSKKAVNADILFTTDDVTAQQSMIGKNYGEITKYFLGRYGDTEENRRIDRKWRKIGTTMVERLARSR